MGTSASKTRRQDHGLAGARHITHGLGGSAAASFRKPTGRKVVPQPPMGFRESPPTPARENRHLHPCGHDSEVHRLGLIKGGEMCVFVSESPWSESKSSSWQEGLLLDGAEFYERL